MITAANSTYEASSSSSAAAADPPRPGPVGTPPAVAVVERQRDVLGRELVECAVGRQEGQGHGWILTRSMPDGAVPGEAIEP